MRQFNDATRDQMGQVRPGGIVFEDQVSHRDEDAAPQRSLLQQAAGIQKGQ